MKCLFVFFFVSFLIVDFLLANPVQYADILGQVLQEEMLDQENVECIYNVPTRTGKPAPWAKPQSNVTPGQKNHPDQLDTEIQSRSHQALCPWFPRICRVYCRKNDFATGYCSGEICTCKNFCPGISEA